MRFDWWISAGDTSQLPTVSTSSPKQHPLISSEKSTIAQLGHISAIINFLCCEAGVVFRPWWLQFRKMSIKDIYFIMALNYIHWQITTSTALINFQITDSSPVCSPGSPAFLAEAEAMHRWVIHYTIYSPLDWFQDDAGSNTEQVTLAVGRRFWNMLVLGFRIHIVGLIPLTTPPKKKPLNFVLIN